MGFLQRFFGHSGKRFKIRGEQITQLVPEMGGCFATDQITVEGRLLNYMYREISQRSEDSGWRFFSGEESQAYIDDLKNTSVYTVNTIANYEPAIIEYLETPAPCAFERIPGSRHFRLVER